MGQKIRGKKKKPLLFHGSRFKGGFLKNKIYVHRCLPHLVRVEGQPSEDVFYSVSVLSDSSQNRPGVRGDTKGRAERTWLCFQVTLRRSARTQTNRSSSVASTRGDAPHTLLTDTHWAAQVVYNINNTALAIINTGIIWFLFPCCQWIQKILTATLIPEQTGPLDFCSDVLKVWALRMDTQEDWPLPQLVKSYTSLDCLQTLLEGRGPEEVCAERLRILVNCLSGYG